MPKPPLLKSALAVLVLAVLLSPTAATATVRGELTPEQRAYLDELGTVLIAVDPDWMPYERLTEDGEFIGIAADLMRLMTERLAIDWQIVPTKDWDESLELSKSGGCHILPFLNQTPARDEWLIFTDPYFTNPSVFVTRADHDYISEPAALKGKTIVLPAGTSTEERVRRDYPNLEVLTVPSEADTFRYVEERRADMTLRSLTMAAYVIRKEGWFNLKIAGEIPAYANQLRMGVRKDLTMLRDILNQGVHTLTPQEVQDAINRHIPIQVGYRVDYRLVARVAGGAAVLLALGLIWVFQLRRARRALLEVNRQLQESERSKSVLIANLPGIAYRCRYHPDWTMEFISDGCRALTGYSSKDLVLDRVVSYGNLIVPDMRQTIWDRWEQTARQRKPLKMEYRIHTADGREKWVLEQGVVIHDDQGRPAFVEGLIIDINDQKLTEEALRRSEERWRSIVKTSPDGMVVATLDGTIVEVSNAMLQMSGYDTEDLVGHPMQEFLADDENRKKALYFLSELLQGRYTGVAEYEVVGKDRSILTVEANAEILRDPNGQPTHFFIIERDITERKRMQVELLQNARLQEIVADISAAFIQANPHNIHILIDRMLARCGEFLGVDRTFLFRISEDGSTLSNTTEWCAPGIEHVNESIQHFPVANVPWIANILAKRQIFMVPDVHALPEGPDKDELQRQQVQSVLALPIIIGNDQLIGYFGFDAVRSSRVLDAEQIRMLQILTNILGDALLKDIYEREILAAKEKADAASQAKTAFLATVSHEIRTPMNAVIGFAELLSMDLADDRQRQKATIIANSGKSLLRLINDLLDLSKAEAGRLDVHPEPVALQPVLQEIEDLLSQRATQKGLYLSFCAAPDMPTTIQMDPERLRQILVNLIGNAIKFTEDGGVTVTTHLLRSPDYSVADPVCDIQFTVIDTGLGIPDAHKASLFQSFEQVPGQDRVKYGGTGLGLAISRQLARLMGGDIEVADNPAGAGAVFTVTFQHVPVLDTSPPRVAECPFPPFTADLRAAIEDARLTLQPRRAKEIARQLHDLADGQNLAPLHRMADDLQAAAVAFQVDHVKQILDTLTPV